ncbi:MAG: cytochrome P450 [Acidimicrobiia bacterium]|nr:cytochrome P450 [Acidimicrobiia bacterium]
MTSQEPVTDWAKDFDYFDPEFVNDPYPVWEELRGRCPVAHTERRGGAWMPSRYEELNQVTHDTEHYSSVMIGVTGPKPGESPLLVAPPITSDPPDHALARRLLLPAFSPKPVDKLEPTTRGIARELIADINARGDGLADAAREYSQHLPVRVISLMLGVPRSDEAQFTDWVTRVLQIGPTDLEAGRVATKEVLAYFKDLIEQRTLMEEHPDDLLSYLMDVRLEDGEPLSEKHLLGTCFLILVAGIDTTWSSIGSSLLHLATHPEDLERLVAEPDLVPTAIEEFLRAYAPVTMARMVTAETTLGGQQLCPGDRVLLPFPAGNRDPAVFDDPEQVLIDRQHNRHAAFGLGIHRCLGSNLARMELRVAVEEWLAAFPTFSLVEGADVRWNGGQVRGPRSIPVQVATSA